MKHHGQNSQQASSSTNGNNKQIKAQEISLPKAGGTIQSAGEKLEVQEFTGSSSFSIPLPISPCRNIAPSLAVSYSTGGGNSSFGLGFNVGLPKISRKTSKGIPKYDDTDTFLFADSEDLIPISNNGITTQQINIHGNQTKTKYDVQKYYLRHEGSFSLIEFWRPVAQRNKYTGSFWKVIDRAHTVSIYGFNEEARIVDTKNKEHIFAWLLEESYNDHGDHQLFFYKSEIDKAARYIEKIRYGHDEANHDSIILNNKNHDEYSNDWHFELVFDYGKYGALDNTSNTYAINLDNTYNNNGSLLEREDAFSSYQSGFEVRNKLLCCSVLMFHKFSNLGYKREDSNPKLVSSVTFQYSINNAGINQLQSFTHTGYKDGKPLSMPAQTFIYSEFKPKAGTFLPLTNENGEALSALNEPKAGSYSFIDLFGEGIAGILYSDGQSCYYRRPQGAGKYSTSLSPSSLSENSEYIEGQTETDSLYYGFENLESFPAYRQVKSQDVALMDVTGNGQLDLVTTGAKGIGYWEASSDSSWKNYKSLDKWPTDYNAPGQTWVDMEGDGLSCLLQIKHNEIRYYPSERDKGLGMPVIVANEKNIPNLLQNSPTKAVLFSDMNGSGRSHIVSISSGRVEYWPNLGYGKFGDKVTMDNAPEFDHQFDSSRLFVTDLDGSGTGDLVYMTSTKAIIYLNYSGNSFSDAIEIALPFKFDNTMQVAFADIHGRGTMCMIISDPKAALYDPSAPRHFYYDFCQGIKPYLLKASENNRGHRVEIEYGSSVDFYLADKKAGLPWITNVPFPVHVVIKHTDKDLISNVEFSSYYAYHHGHYDGVEREFRGFGRVDTQSSEYFAEAETNIAEGDIEYTAPSITRTWYNIGGRSKRDKLNTQYAAEYYQGDVHAKTLNNNEIDWFGNITSDWKNTDAIDSDKYLAELAFEGSVLRTELYGLDDSNKTKHPYAVTIHNYHVKCLQKKGENKYSVLQLHEKETLSYNYERNPLDPHISHSMIMELDGYGNVKSSASIIYPRRDVDGKIEEQQRLHILISENNYINQIEVVADQATKGYLLGIPTESKSYEFTGFTYAGENLINFTELRDSLANNLSNKKLLSWQRHKYKQESGSGNSRKIDVLPLLIDAQESAIFTKEEVSQAFTEILVEDDLNSLLSKGHYRYEEDNGFWWNPGDSIEYNDSDKFYSQLKTRDRDGHETSYEYDSYNLTLEKVTDPVGNVVTVEDIDYESLSATKSKDINDNISEVKLDALGRVIYTSVSGTEYRDGSSKNIGFDSINLAPEIAESDIESILTNPSEYLGNMQSYVYYDVFAWQDRKEPIQILSLRAEQYPMESITTPVQMAVSYSDGMGRELQSKAKTDDGRAFNAEGTEIDSANRWLTSGRVLYNNKGKPVKQYEPYYSDSHAYINNKELNKFGVSPIMFYDPLDRVTHTITPKGYVERHEFTPWQETVYSANDTLVDSPYVLENLDIEEDEQTGRLLVTIKDNRNADSPYYDKDLDDLSLKKNSIVKYIEYILNGYNSAKDTPEIDNVDLLTIASQSPVTNIKDNLGNIVLNQQILKSPTNQTIIEHKNIYDITKRPISSADGRFSQHNKNADNDMRYNYIMHYGMSGKALKTQSSDSGTIWHLEDIYGKPIYSRDARGTVITNEYDALHRATLQKVKNETLDNIIVRVVYGDDELAINLADAQAKNLRGKAYISYDNTGKSQVEAYSLTGGPLSSKMQLAKNYKEEPNWTDDNIVTLSLLQEEIYTTRISYDGMGRATETIDVKNHKTIPGYNPLNQLKTLNMITGAGADETIFVEDIDYDPKGQRNYIKYGNGLQTDYSYDDKTYELIRITTAKTNDSAYKVQDMSYIHDPMHNIFEKTDHLQNDVYYNGIEVKPISSFKYDSLNRLVKSSGREQVANINLANQSDYFKENFSKLKNDAEALQQYSEEYRYDINGNMLNTVHSANNTSWTKKMSVSDISNRSVINSINNGEMDSHLDTEAIEEYFDASGNQIDQAENKLHWNYRNNIAKAIMVNRENKAGEINNNDAEYYVYDGKGNRIRKILELYTANTINITETVYLGNIQIHTKLRSIKVENTDQYQDPELQSQYYALQIKDDARTIATKYIIEQGEPFGSGITDSQRFWNLEDNLGSHAMKLDNMGRILSFEEYGAYGNTTISATGNTAVSYLKPESGLDQSNGVGSDIAVDLSLLLKIHRYSGKERDVATGLYYYGMRYYSTSTCRWLSADPAGPVDGLNLYQFVGSNPINFTDPDGRMMVRKRDLRNQSKKVTNNNKGNNNKTDLTMNNQNKVKNDLDFITPSQKISNNKEEIDTINTNIKSLNAENQSLKENMMAYQNSYNQGKITILLREFKLEEYKNRVRQFSENEKKINNYSKRKDTLARENNQAWKEINKLHNDQAKRLMDEKLQDESRNTKLTSLPSMINIISTVGNALGAIIEPNSGIIISVFAFLISFTVATIDFSEKKKYYNKKQNLQIAVSKVGVLGSHIAIALAGGDKNLISDVNDQKSLIQEEDIKYGMVALGLFLLILGMSVEHKIKKT